MHCADLVQVGEEFAVAHSNLHAALQKADRFRGRAECSAALSIICWDYLLHNAPTNSHSVGILLASYAEVCYMSNASVAVRTQLKPELCLYHLLVPCILYSSL